MLFPEQEILFMFLFPMKAKYMVMLYGGIFFLLSFQRGSTVSNLAHLGGMIFGYIYIKAQFGRRRSLVPAPRFVLNLSGAGKNTSCSAPGRSSRCT